MPKLAYKGKEVFISKSFPAKKGKSETVKKNRRTKDIYERKKVVRVIV